MIVHVFNSSVVSGPEKLVLPALARAPGQYLIVNLVETRLIRPGAADPLEAYCRSLGLPYQALPVRGRWDRTAMRALADLLRAREPRLVHAHVGKASVYLSRCRGALKAGTPLVSTHHGVRGLPDLKTRLYELLYRRVFLRRFDRVLCVSTEDFDAVRRSGLDAGKVRLHLNGVDGRRLDAAARRAERPAIRSAWLGPDAREDLFLFGVVGRLSREKDHDRLLRVLAELQRLGAPADWRCVVLGAGALERPLKETARRLGLDRRVVWLGYREDAGRELAGLDLLLSFSKAEGLPVNLIEAGWAGTPAAATLVGGVKDLLPDDAFGTGIPPGEPADKTARRLAALLAPPGRDALEAQGRRFQERVAERFSRARWLARLGEIYDELGVRLEP